MNKKMNKQLPILHYERVKPFEDAPRALSQEPLVMTHGLFGSGNNLMTLARLFARERPVYLVDLPNHGASPWIDDASYRSAAFCLHRTLAEIVPDRNIHLFGHSMGGKAVMALTLLCNTWEASYSLGSISVGDIAPRAYQSGHEVYFNAMKAIPEVQSRKEADEYMAPIVKNLQLRSFLLKNLGRGANGQFSWKLNLDVLIRDYPLIISWDFDPELQSKTPALFLYGLNSDYIIPSRDRDCIGKYFLHARLEGVQHSAHWIHSEQPASVHRLINTFIAGL